jgi:signal recognition particle receptor subunit beta
MKTILTVVIIALSSACTFNASKQNPEKAAASAVEFAKVAFIDRNVDKAYSLLDPEFQAIAPKEKLNEALAVVNAPTTPTTVTATEFEPVAGQDGMMIYLIGENGSEKFYYRLGMKGTEEKGYKVAGIFRNPEQYPPSELKQPLAVKRITGN